MWMEREKELAHCLSKQIRMDRIKEAVSDKGRHEETGGSPKYRFARTKGRGTKIHKKTNIVECVEGGLEKPSNRACLK